LPCNTEYSIRSLPNPGQSMPSSALVGQTGSGPPGVVGSAIHTAVQKSPAPAATASGAPRRMSAGCCRPLTIAVVAQDPVFVCIMPDAKAMIR